MLRGVGRAAKEWYVGRQRDISSLPPPRDFGPSIEATYRGEYTIYTYGSACAPLSSPANAFPSKTIREKARDSSIDFASSVLVAVFENLTRIRKVSASPSL